MSCRDIGFVAEDSALDYLKQQGLTLIHRNFNCRMGEIDLIMRDGRYMVFIEVRARTNPRFGGGIASITPAKKHKIMRTATYYLMQQNLYEKVPLRFDVVSIDGSTKAISWVKDAFGEDY